ncbi:hypothetical protein OKW33_007588 [Paraburkholderia atlantica]
MEQAIRLPWFSFPLAGSLDLGGRPAFGALSRLLLVTDGLGSGSW